MAYISYNIRINTHLAAGNMSALPLLSLHNHSSILCDNTSLKPQHQRYQSEKILCCHHTSEMLDAADLMHHKQSSKLSGELKSEISYM